MTSRSLFLLLLLIPAPILAQQPVADGLTIAIVSDLNERYGDQFHRDTVHTAVQRLTQIEPDVILITGDMVAGQRSGLDYAGMWAAFHQAFTSPLAGVPIAVSPGNHDASHGSRFEGERAEYGEQWQALPRPDTDPRISMVDGSDYPLRYSFTMESVFFLAVDATGRNAFSRGDQVDWIEAQLSTSEASNAHARILFGHLPLFPVAQGRERDYLLGGDDTRARVETILRDRNVTVFASGHHHSFYPGRRADLPTHLLALGCLGGGPRVLLGDERTIDDTDDPTERSFLLLEVTQEGVSQFRALRGPDFTESIDLDSLPGRVGSGDTTLERDDRL